MSLLAGTLFLFGILLSLSSFDLPFQPGTNQELLFFAALAALIFVLFVALTFVLGRNLLKLFAERRLGVLGSKFRTRLVVAGLLLSFLPVLMMFWFAYGLMNRSIDKWFSRPVEEVRGDTSAMASLLSKYAAQNARVEAESIAVTPETQRAFSGHGFAPVLDEFRRRQAFQCLSNNTIDHSFIVLRGLRSLLKVSSYPFELCGFLQRKNRIRLIVK